MTRLSNSGFRFLIVLGFNAVVAGAFHFFGASLATAWLTFLALTGFGALAATSEDIMEQLELIKGELEAISAKEASRWETLSNAIARIESKVDAI